MKNAHLPLSQVATGREQQLILQLDKCFISLVAFLCDARRDSKCYGLEANISTIFGRHGLEGWLTSTWLDRLCFPLLDQCPQCPRSMVVIYTSLLWLAAGEDYTLKVTPILQKHTSE